MEAKAGHLRLPGACCLLPGPGTSQAREVQGCVSWQRWREGSLLSARGSPWQRHILGGFCGFLRQPVLLGTLQVQVIWVGNRDHAVIQFLGGGCVCICAHARTHT